MPDVDTLILLVGSNTLPNYLAATTLEPRRVVLVHSTDTDAPARRLKHALCEDFETSPSVALEHVADPHDASSVRDAIGKAIENVETTHLNYTGGTKVMSAHAVRHFYEQVGEVAASRASYVDEKNRCLRFDSGEKLLFAEKAPPCELMRVLHLHGVSGEPRSKVDGGPTDQDAAAIADKTLREPTLAKRLYEERRRLQNLKNPAKGVSEPFMPDDYDLNLSVDRIPGEDWSREQFKAWYKFIGGEWLEEWVRSVLLTLNLDGVGVDSVFSGVQCRRDDTGRPFEIDGALVREHRTYVISCTTDSKLGMCKSKAFEVSVRAAQMAGDLARSAIVCFLHREDEQGPFVNQLQADLDDAWAAPNTTRVFGLEDLRHWVGHYGQPNLSSLQDWLDS